jgi:hypothetical protein
MPDALRVQKTISHKGPKMAKSMYQKALLTTTAIRMGTQVGNVVQMRDESGSVRGKRRIPTHRRSGFFDTIHYSYEQKGLQQLLVTKSKQGIAAESTH